MIYDLVISNGTLVTASETIYADLAIQDEQIAAIGNDLPGRAVIDARGKLVIPGAVDPHVHLQMPTGVTVSSDDWRSGTMAAAWGGTTTIIDFVEPQEPSQGEPGETLLDAFAARKAEAQGQAVIDYGLHMTLPSHVVGFTGFAEHSPPDRRHLNSGGSLAEIPAVIEAGLTSFKTYTTYDGFRLDDQQLLAAMRAVAEAGGLVMTHCENDAIVQRCQQELLAAGQTGPSAHPRSRPAVAEGEAVERVLALAQVAGVPLYIVHVSTARGAAAVARARARGQTAYGETCPQYLFLTEDEYERPGFDGAKFACQPPLRSAADRAALWQALASGSLLAIGTDHCPFNVAGQKDLGRHDFTQIPGGLPGIESRLALIYSGISPHTSRFTFHAARYASLASHLTLNHWIELCCTNPAKLFGLYPRKGTLMPGADADVVIFDPQRQVTLSHDFLHEHVDYTPYEGMRLQGWPEVTISRGRVLVRDGEFVGPAGGGRFLPRKRFPDLRSQQIGLAKLSPSHPSGHGGTE